jgi:hypothetical protein
MNNDAKEQFIQKVSKFNTALEDEFKAEYNSPELIWHIFERMYDIFERVLTTHVATNELRNFYRERAGVPKKYEE